MTDPYSGNWGRIVRPGGSGMPRPMGSGLAGRMVRPMGASPLTRGAVAGISSGGIVTVWETSGAQRWSTDLGLASSTEHDLSFFTDGSIYVRTGDGQHLIHISKTGTVLSDTAIGFAFANGGRPTIDYSPSGLAYSNPLATSDDTSRAVAIGPTGSLFTGVFNSSIAGGFMGITDSGYVVQWTGGLVIIWDPSGAIVDTVGFLSVAIGGSYKAAAVDRVADILHVYVYSTFSGVIETGRVDLTDGTVSSGSPTAFGNVSIKATHTGAISGGLYVRENMFDGTPTPSKLDHTRGGIICCGNGKIEFSSDTITAAWSNTDQVWRSCAGFHA